MTPGRFIAVVGPSGVGKDSLIAGLAAARPDLHVVRRCITRAPGLGGEAYEALSEAAFEARRAAGAFCLSWEAHGLRYGLPGATVTVVAAGRDAVANLSRAALRQAAAVFPDLCVLNLTAAPETLARRLAARGREDVADIRARLARAPLDLPAGLAVVDIANDGPIEETVGRALAALAALGAVRA